MAADVRPPENGPVVLDGSRLTPAEVADVARGLRTVELDVGVPARLEANALQAALAVERSRSYGRSTGVGANHHVVADDSDGLHGRRLLRSHAAGAGPLLPAEVGRALMVIRLNQLAAARSGLDPHLPQALLDALTSGCAPVVRSHGGLGTGDITVLAELGLSLLGERPWSDGTSMAFVDDIDASGALPLMSSSAPTLAVAALALHDLRALVDALTAVSALSALAVRANAEAWSVVGASSRPHPGMVETGRRLRVLLDHSSYVAPRLQDPFGWRCMVAVHGALLDSLDAATRQVQVDINASVENPLYVDGGSWHHGGFHHLGLALALDQLRLALLQAAGLSVSRLTKLNDPSFTHHRPFLAEGPDGSSGTMVLEYTAASAVAELRQCAAPATLGHAVVSLGLEDHASFAWQSAMATRSCLPALHTVLGCELVAAVRAIRLQGAALSSTAGHALEQLMDVCAPLPQPGQDLPPCDDVALAGELLGALGGAAAASYGAA